MKTLALALQQITETHISRPEVTTRWLQEQSALHCPDYSTARLCFFILHAAYFGGMWYEVQAWIAQELKGN